MRMLVLVFDAQAAQIFVYICFARLLFLDAIGLPCACVLKHKPNVNAVSSLLFYFFLHAAHIAHHAIVYELVYVVPAAMRFDARWFEQIRKSKSKEKLRKEHWRRRNNIVYKQYKHRSFACCTTCTMHKSVKSTDSQNSKCVSVDCI